jgi:hypothetical protein
MEGYPIKVRGAQLVAHINWKWTSITHNELYLAIEYPDGRDAEWTAHLREEEYDDIDRQVMAQMRGRGYDI